MKRKIAAVVTLSVVLIILLAAIIIFNNLYFADCDNLKNEAKSLLKKANYCSADSDCILSAGLSCPFGCYNLINKNADITVIKEVAERYFECQKRLGLTCIELLNCMPPPAQEQIKCINNKCIDSRFENK